MTAPTLTIVVPCYNHAKYLAEALDAISGQTRAPDAVIFIDDASTDGSADIAARFAVRIPCLRLLRHTSNLGVNATCREGLELTRTSHVMFAASDDRLLPEILARSVELLAAHPQAGLCSAGSCLINEVGAQTGLCSLVPPRRTPGYLTAEESRRALYRSGSWFMGNTTVFRTDALRAIGGFRESLGPYADGFASMVLALRHGACFAPETLACWRRMKTGYAASVAQDAGCALEILQRVRSMMQTEFPELLSSEEIRRWEGRWRFNAALPLLQSNGGSALFTIRTLLSPARASTWLLENMVRIIGGRNLIVKGLLYACLRPYDVAARLTRW